MSYQVLARKWRPRNFQELVGQEHIVQALSNALRRNRLHHAYLFTGTRGVGKTTIARIFAKTLSCHSGITAVPCGTCSACTDIDAGVFVDLVEVDAASRTKVEETRDLLENVAYAPTQGRFKIYLIDEVHMFSGHSFNALLKTLEEPPPHVKFLLATTDPKKLPVTILSRCLQFNLKHVRPDLIGAHLARILAAENVAHDDGSLSLIARAADGSVRDALSLLDQAIAYSGGNLQESEVRQWLGTLERGQVPKLLQCVARGEVEGLFAMIEQIAEYDPDYTAVLAEILEELHGVAVSLALGAGAATAERSAAAPELVGLLSPEDCQLFYQIAILGRRDLPLAADARSGFEMVLLRMLAFQRQTTSSTATPPTPNSAAAKLAVPSDSGSQIASQAARYAPSSQSDSPLDSIASAAGAVTPLEAGLADELDWRGLLDELQLGGLVRELAMNCTIAERNARGLVLSIAPGLSHLRSAAVEGRLESALQARFGEGFKLAFTVGPTGARQTPAELQAQEQREARAAAEHGLANDPAVRKLHEIFGATIAPGSVAPGGGGPAPTRSGAD